MAQDSGVTWEQLQIEMNTPAGGSSGGDPNMRFFLEGEYLLAKEGNEVVELGVLRGWDSYYDDPNCLTTRSLKRLIVLLGILMDEEVLRRADMKNKNKEIYGANNTEQEVAS